MDHIIDITPPVTSTMAVWPGDTPFSRKMLCEIDRGANIDLSSITTTVHLGAHADGSNHYASAKEGGVGVGEMPLGHYLGPCQVIDAPVPGERSGERRVRVEDLVGGIEQVNTLRVLIRTGSFNGFHDWNADFAGLTPELIDALADRGVITIGVDTPSVDVQDSKELPAHRAIFRRSIAILEGLDLAKAPAGSGHEYELVAPPLKLLGCDASPVRAVLWTSVGRIGWRTGKDPQTTLDLAGYPLYVYIPDERSFFRADNPKSLQYFEQIDLEDDAHYAWDCRGRLYHLWFEGVVVPRLIDIDGLSKLAHQIDLSRRAASGLNSKDSTRCPVSEMTEMLSQARRHLREQEE